MIFSSRSISALARAFCVGVGVGREKTDAWCQSDHDDDVTQEDKEEFGIQFSRKATTQKIETSKHRNKEALLGEKKTSFIIHNLLSAL